jgi:nucleotide-binding universal stress UspA family protein
MTVRQPLKELVMYAIKSILHPTDFSEYSQAGFRLACALARDYGARLLLLHVARQAGIAPFMATIPAEPEHHHEEMTASLAKLRAEAAGIAVEERLAFSDNPAAEIVRCAEQFQCDLIVMGTHGRTGLGRVLMGSVAEAVTRKSNCCPVLTVKMPLPEDAVGWEKAGKSETIVI